MARRLFIFDCDGVLVDSEPLAAKAYVRAFARHGLVIDVSVIAACVGLKQADILVCIETLTGMVFPPEHADDIWAETRQMFSQELRPVPGIEAFLAALAAPRCVASSSSLERITHSLTVTGLLAHFEGQLFSSSMVARGKPAPDLFLHAAQQMGHAPSECVVIEDSPFGVKAALAAGIFVIGFTGGSHTHARHADQLHEAGADLVLDSWPAVAQWRRSTGA